MKEGWEYKKLGEVATYINGFPFKPSDWKEIGKPIIRIQNLTNPHGGFNRCSRNDIPEKYFVVKGDVLISWSATLGVFEWESEDALLNQHIFKVVFDKADIDKHFFKYAVLMSITEMAKHTNGATMKHIRKGDFDNIKIPYPSLSEQQSIVDYLDSAFAKIDAMKANAEKALNEAKALFQASLKEMLEPKEGWEEKKLCEVVNIINGYAFPSKAFGDNQELKVVKITNVGVGTFIEDISTLPNKMFIQDVCLKEGDIVIALTRTIISDGLKRAIIPSSYDGAMLNQRVASLRYSGNINMSFLYYYLGCSLVSDYVWLHVNTLMQPNLSIKDLKDLPVCNPPFSEQQSIVATLDSLKSKVDRLQANYAKISLECDALKQAILRQVFE